MDPAPGVRLLGVSVSHLAEGAAHQLAFDEIGTAAADWDDASDAVDAIRARFGDDAVAPAAAFGPGGARVKRRGDQQWGPDQRRPG